MDSPSHTVLVVDDDASIRFLCRVNLELDGWTVREAPTIPRAREAIGEGDIDIVLLDVHVGSDNGIDFLGELRERHPGLPVVMLTGSVGSSSLESAKADAVISKPFTLDQLTGTVGSLVGRAPRDPG